MLRCIILDCDRVAWKYRSTAYQQNAIQHVGLEPRPFRRWLHRLVRSPSLVVSCAGVNKKHRVHGTGVKKTIQAFGIWFLVQKYKIVHIIVYLKTVSFPFICLYEGCCLIRCILGTPEDTNFKLGTCITYNTTNCM